MATVNYEILRPELPAAVGGSVMSGISSAQQVGAQQLQNQLGQLQLAQAGQEIAEQNKLRELMASGVDLDSPEVIKKMYQISPKQGMAFEKSRAELTKNRTEAQLKQFEADQQRYSNLSFNPSNENVVANLQDMVLERRISPEQAAQMQQKILTMPIEERGKFFLAMGADAKTRYTHGTVSAGTAASNAVTMRGQNMQDARARERLSQEMAGGTLTPETIDVAANMYLKTGQMPQLGMGKQAAAARQQILNRATVLGTTGADGQPAPTTADVAGNIVGAKQDYKSQEKAVKDFSTGMQGRQVNSFNTAIDHLDTMGKLSDALANGDTKAINAIGNMVAKQTGAPAPTSFNAAKQIVTAEVIKSIVASGGGVKERQEAEANFAAANSPAQLKGVINAYKDLMGGQLKSLELQYGNTTGRKDFEKKLTPAAKEELSKVKSNLTGADAQALEWAKANPSDPRATKILQRLGVQ
jgi:hypothetical protein